MRLRPLCDTSVLMAAVQALGVGREEHRPDRLCGVTGQGSLGVPPVKSLKLALCLLFARVNLAADWSRPTPG